MVPKITPGSNFYGILAYCEQKQQQVLFTYKGTLILPGSERLSVYNFSDGVTYLSSVRELASGFKEYTYQNKRLENGVFHCSLSFAKEDQLENNKLTQIANDFLEKMGYAGIPTAVYRHNDTGHLHLHLVASRRGIDGKKIDDFNEVKRAIEICRQLERKYHLKEVGSTKLEADLSLPAEIDLDALPKAAFKSTVLRNLNYFLYGRRVSSIDDLKSNLAAHHIDMVTTDGNGQELPNAGVLFYRIVEGKRKGPLKGRDFGKGFGKRIFAQLRKNAPDVRKKRNDAMSSTRFLKPTWVLQRKYGPLIAGCYDAILAKVLYSETDIHEVFRQQGIQATIHVTPAGELRRILLEIEGNRYKPSDFWHMGSNLSAAHLKKGLVRHPSGDALRQVAFKHLSQYLVSSRKQHLSLSEIHLVLNRRGICLDSMSTNPSLFFEVDGQSFKAPFQSHKACFSFLSKAGWDGSDDLSHDQHEILASIANLVPPLTGIREQVIYDGMVKNDLNSLRRLAKYNITIPLHDQETNLFRSAILYLSKLHQINTTLIKARRFLDASSKQGNSLAFTDVVKALNKRGIGIEWNADLATGKIKKCEFFLLDDPGPRQTAFDGPRSFDFRYLNDLFLSSPGMGLKSRGGGPRGEHYLYSSDSIRELNSMELHPGSANMEYLPYDPNFQEEYLFLLAGLGQIIDVNNDKHDTTEDVPDWLLKGNEGTLTNRGMDEDFFAEDKRRKRHFPGQA